VARFTWRDIEAAPLAEAAGRSPGRLGPRRPSTPTALEYFGRLSEAERAELHRLLARLIERPA
jgi:hypothetical protein